jgi:hypothetical protein
MKMKDRNAQLKSALGQMVPKERVEAANGIPKENTTNRQGYAAYELSDELRLITMLNTLKLEPQYYRSENQTMKELRDLIERLALKDPYFVAQAIVYSRCMRDGMRSINHLAAALLSPFISGKDYAKRFYSLFDKKKKQGGCIYRVDDMSEIKDVYNALNNSTLSNAMKKGFASAIVNLDAYSLAKYKDTIIDISNLVHPNSALSNAVVEIDGQKIKVIDAIMNGVTVSADTWEVAQSEAGQEVAKAVKEGKISQKEAEQVLADAKNDNWESLLAENKLGILAAIRNLRNMLKNPKKDVIDKVCALISDGDKIRAGKIMPYQIDYAYEVTKLEFGNTMEGRQVLNALLKGYEMSIPNLAEALPGRTCVMVDCSGSMSTRCYQSGKERSYIQTTAAEKAGLIAATIAKATGADVVRFGSRAEFYPYDPNNSVFSLGRAIGNDNMGGTSIPSAFELIRSSKKKYDRIILLSDNECNSSWNGNWVSTSLKNYIREVTDPYVYAVDLAAYGTTPVAGNKVNYYFGYGTALFEDIASKEFNPMQHIEAVRKVVI